MPRRPVRFLQLPWRSRSRIASDVDTELAFHLDMRVSELIARGMPREDATRRAREEFGDLEFTRAYMRRTDAGTERANRAADHLEDLQQDARYAWRTLRRSPGFAVVSILTLALAIGANTAIVSVARGVLLRPLPYGAPESLVAVYQRTPKSAANRIDFSGPTFVDLRAQQKTFTGVAAFLRRLTTWRLGAADPQIATAVRVTANLFDVLRVQAWHGRTFVAGEDTPSAAPAVVISYRFWERELGADTAIVGRTITLDNRQYDVIGIMPRGFALTGDEAMWIPLDLSDDLARATVTRKQHFFEVIARLRPGVSIDAAREDLLAITRRLQADYPEAEADYRALADPLHETMASRLERPVLLLLGAAALILLIACANLANVTLSRSMGRRTEMGVRAALGAGRARLARQMLTESLLLSLLGGLLGVLLAAGATRWLLALNPDMLPGLFAVRLDGSVLLVSAVISVGTGMLFGLAPAIDASRTDLQRALKDRSRGGTGGHAAERLRRGLVVAQVGLAVMLLVGAGLLVRSFRQLTTVQLGYDPDRVLTAQLRVEGARYDSASVLNQFYDRVLTEIDRAPGVVAAGAAMYAPAQGKEYTSMFVEGSSADPTRVPSIAYNMARGAYFEALRIPIRAGRVYDERDVPDQPNVAVINEAAARQFFPNGDVVGRRVRIGPNPKAAWTTIIGVVGDMRDAANWVAPEPTIYDNSRQQTWWGTLTVVVRTTGDAETAIPVLRRAVRAADPTLAVRNVATLDTVIGATLSGRRFALGLASCFAALALVLAAVGIYGVLSYAVTTRTREFGVRLALGATGSSVLMLVLRQGLGWSLLGLVIGVGGAVAGGRLLAAFLYGVTATDAVTFVVVGVGLVVVVALACLIPATRATRVDPITSLRAE